MPELLLAVKTPVVVASFSLYTLAIVAIGLYSARYARRSDEDYFLAGRSLGGWVAALSASASSESGWVTLGLVGWAFTEGVKAYWIIPGCLLGFLFNWFVIAGRLSDRARALGAVTLPDFFAFYFKERAPLVRTLSVIVILVAMFLYVAAQFAAAGKAFEASFEQINYQRGVLIGAAIVLVYTVTGGFRAVCWTDFLQALLMVGTLVVFPTYLLLTEGGYTFVSQQLQTVSPELLDFTPSVGVIAFIGFLLGSGALGINFGYPGQPHVLVRFMALKQRKEARLAGVVSFFWGLMVYWGAVTIGLIARSMTQAGAIWGQQMLEKPDIYGELGLVLSAMHMLPGVLSGMVLAAVLAAICSTADSQLVVAASSAAGDLYARVIDPRPERSHLLINRLTVFVLGVAAVLMVINQEIRVYKYVLTYGWAILGASFGPQLILLLLWKRASYAGCLAGMLVGFIVAIVWPNVYDAEATGVEIYNLPLAFVCALIVNVVLSLIRPKTAETGTASRATGSA
ncbi:MAG: sodium/proline symporter [Phycisphaerae bacterium]